jgi:hypothetical protein
MSFLFDCLALIGLGLVAAGLAAIWWPLSLLWAGAVFLCVGLRGPVVADARQSDQEAKP